MVRNALHAYVSVISFTIKLEGLVVNRAKLMIFSYLFFLTGQLQNYKILCEHVWFDLRVMFVATSRAVEELLLLVYDRKALLADCVATVEVPRCFLLGIVEVVTHRTLHCKYN